MCGCVSVYVPKYTLTLTRRHRLSDALEYYIFVAVVVVFLVMVAAQFMRDAKNKTENE